MRNGADPAVPLRILDATAARSLVTEALETVAALEAVLAEETGHVRAGRVRQGLANEPRKAELAGRYLTRAEAVKANAIALARFAPEGVQRLKQAHQRLAQAVQTNQTVLATARTVSENLVKEISAELGRTSRAETYGRVAPNPSPYGAPQGGPLVLSRSL